MEIQEIRQAYYAEPFKPFVIRLLDGRKFRVAQPYNIAIAPSGQELAYSKPNGGFAWIALAEVDRLEHPKKKKSKR